MGKTSKQHYTEWSNDPWCEKQFSRYAEKSAIIYDIFKKKHNTPIFYYSYWHKLPKLWRYRRR